MVLGVWLRSPRVTLLQVKGEVEGSVPEIFEAIAPGGFRQSLGGLPDIEHLAAKRGETEAVCKPLTIHFAAQDADLDQPEEIFFGFEFGEGMGGVVVAVAAIAGNIGEVDAGDPHLAQCFQGEGATGDGTFGSR